MIPRFVKTAAIATAFVTAAQPAHALLFEMAVGAAVGTVAGVVTRAWKEMQDKDKANAQAIQPKAAAAPAPAPLPGIEKYIVCNGKIYTDPTPPAKDCVTIYTVPDISPRNLFLGRFAMFIPQPNSAPPVAGKRFTVKVDPGVLQEFEKQTAHKKEIEFRSTRGWQYGGEAEASVPFFFSANMSEKLSRILNHDIQKGLTNDIKISGELNRTHSRDVQASFTNEERSASAVELDGNVCDTYDVIEYTYYRHGQYSVSDIPNFSSNFRIVERVEYRAESHCDARKEAERQKILDLFRNDAPPVPAKGATPQYILDLFRNDAPPVPAEGTIPQPRGLIHN